MKMYIRNIVYTAAWSLLIASCSSDKEKKQEPVEPKKNTGISAPPTFSPAKGILSSSLQIPGELVAFQQVDIYAKVSSFVKKLNADVGTQVTTGQLLATMEAPEISSQLSGAESRLQSLEALYIASKANYNRL